MAKGFSDEKPVPFKSVTQLIQQGRKLPELEPLKWELGQGKRQTAYLCFSSGTSGLPVSPLAYCTNSILELKNAFNFFNCTNRGCI